MITLTGANKEFPAYIARPSGEVKGGLIVIHEVWGLVDHTKSVADRFAEQGYLVIAPNLLDMLGLSPKTAQELQEALFDPERRNQVQPRLRELMTPMQAPGFGEETLQKIESCYNYLTEQKEVQNKIGVAGFCFGGTYSFSLAVHQPNLVCAVPFYGHANFEVDDLKKITCPIVAFYGENDERLMASLPELKEKMEAASVDFTAQVYKNCGHAFFNDSNPFAYNEEAAQAAWQKTLEFMEKCFG